MEQPVIVVDDERTFNFEEKTNEQTVYCRDSLEALGVLARIHCDQSFRYAPSIYQLWLDHDLGGEDDIRIVVDFLTLVKLDIHDIYVHSQNPTVAWIVTALRRAGYRAHRTGLPELN